MLRDLTLLLLSAVLACAAFAALPGPLNWFIGGIAVALLAVFLVLGRAKQQRA